MHDPVFEQTSWNPIARGGHAWPTHHLVINEVQGRAEFRSNIPQRKSWIMLCEVIGWMLLVWQVVFSDMYPLASGTAQPGLVWLTFAFIALPIYALTLRSVVFDLRSGKFWEQGFDWRARPCRGIEGSIEGIYAIQLLPERMSSSNSRTPFSSSYELNIVNHRGRRLNLVDHCFLSWIRRDAQNLAIFLDVQLWDITPESELNITQLKNDVMRRSL